MQILKNNKLIDLFFEKTLDYSPNEFLEVGCFEASASKKISLELLNCNVTAYEANPFNYNHFKDELKNYNISYVNKAISNFEGKTSFFLQNFKENIHVRGNNSLLKRTDSKTYTEVTVECNTLNNLHNNNNTFAMWIDAEGHGYEVLEGADRLLTNTKFLLIEVEMHKFWVDQKLDTDIINLLSTKGFVGIARDQEYPKQYNILFENTIL